MKTRTSKRIHFDHKLDWKILVILLLATGLYAIAYYFKTGEVGSSKFLFVMGGALNAVALSKIFWYKYYVQWNSKSIILRFNSFSGHSILFSNIKNFEFTDSELTISILKSNKKITLPTEEIAKEDLQTLQSIFLKNTGPKSKLS